ncbi:MAG: AtzE family amidohydrolase [Parvibaculaceae bacterium]
MKDRSTRAAPETASARIEAALAAIDRMAALNAVTTVLAERARRRAALLDRQLGRGEAAGPLHGMPFAAKNLFDVEGLVTRAGSASTARNPPAARDAFAVAAIERAGGILVALTNMDELAYGFSGENAHDGHARNPRDPARWAGGSSSGSAALVAAGAVAIALGSDTNGSIRVPAALCGTFSLKPTFGRLSRRGAFPFVATLDHVGVLAAGVRILAATYDALQGRDPDDPFQAGRPVEAVSPYLDAGLAGLRIGVLGDYFAAPLSEGAGRAVSEATGILSAAKGPRLTRAAQGRAAAFVTTACESGSLHLRALGERPEAFGPLVRERLMAGALTPSSLYIGAQKLRRLLSSEIADLFRTYDVLIAPATPCAAPLLGADTLEVEGQSLPARSAIGMFTQALTLTGVPIGVAPSLGRDDGLPVGIQVICPPWREDLVLRVLAVLEREGFAAGLAPDCMRGRP